MRTTKQQTLSQRDFFPDCASVIRWRLEFDLLITIRS